jgi:hypothetical protein
MTEQCFQLVADVSSDDPAAIESLLRRMVQGQITVTAGSFPVEADMIGASAPDLNRWLFSALGQVERRTRLQANGVRGRCHTPLLRLRPQGDRPASC